MDMDYEVTAGENLTVWKNGTWSVVSGFLQAASENHYHYVISIFFSGLYISFLFPVGFIGNILILTVNLTHRGRLSAPDLYFVNLAVADLALVFDSLIEVFNLKQGYYDKAGLCTFMNLFQHVNMYSSVFFLTWMSFDRFVALTGSMGRRMPRPRLSCSLIWVSSSMLTVLPFAVSQAQHAGDLHFCFANVTQIQWLEVILGFLMPFCILGLCYWRIAQVLQRSQRQQRPRRQKALRMISAAVFVFFLCWLPENIFVSIHLLRQDADGSTLWQDYPLTGHAVRLAAFSNSCLNPLIYSFLGETFLDKLRLFLQEKTRWTKLHRSASRKSIYIPAARMCRCGTTPDTHSNCKTLSKAFIFPSDEELDTAEHTDDGQLYT
ncbi:G-protein coupled estrogen receptor 1-like [Sphaeramia orbicularis]|uniref:G-protein coupled estrogen receptor 1 n=1 Tax=Sphaeramia orbicularis TaxID=375764 RepID=A0A673C2L8_9TELE|nr:G-protein coupled estrogen receptor 1-like [Sphaeramia orbicularis]XP_030019402.1 G-protein coupled estrogen receptor 1-like [Sphaeramia orbicularis]XP_030019403.1 G-protein coupled estrogen receptor 1-like [Sphaeramia orbicularis]